MADEDDEEEGLEEELERLIQSYQQARDRGDTETANFYARRLRLLGTDPDKIK